MDFPQVKGNLEKDYPLVKLNTFRIGGTGELVFWPNDIQDVVLMTQWCKENGKPFLFLGRGSNVLLPDQGFKGVVIVTKNLNRIKWQGERGELVLVEAGYSLMNLSREAVSRGLGGLEFACGIPGTIGAAILINAGANGKEIGRLVKNVSVLTTEGQVQILDSKDIEFSYRSSSLLKRNLYVLNSTMILNPSQDSNFMKETINQYMAKRKNTQPLGYPNAGSVFRNPAGDSAGRLIELAGWKGRKIGDAQVSEKHANFIVNLGKAKSEDVLRLISEIQEDINTKFGIRLETEIRTISG